MGYYGPTSVLAFAKFLAQKRVNDRSYGRALAKALGFCSQIHRSGKLSLANHNQLALTAMGIFANALEDSASAAVTSESSTGDFKQRYQKAMSFIIDGLEHTHNSFAEEDFDVENRIPFRNHFLGFPYQLFDTMGSFIEERKEDEWVQRNALKVPNLSPEQLAGLAGHLHFFAECRKLNLAFHRRSPEQIAIKFDCGARTTLDWILNTYELDSELPRQWFRLIQEHEKPVEFQHAGRALLLESLSNALPWKLADDCDLWPSIAMMVDLDRPEFGNEEWAAICSTVFDLD